MGRIGEGVSCSVGGAKHGGGRHSAEIHLKVTFNPHQGTCTTQGDNPSLGSSIVRWVLPNCTLSRYIVKGQVPLFANKHGSSSREGLKKFLCKGFGSWGYAPSEEPTPRVGNRTRS